MVNFHLSVSVLAGEGGFPLSVPLQSHNRAENSEFVGSKTQLWWSLVRLQDGAHREHSRSFTCFCEMHFSPARSPAPPLPFHTIPVPTHEGLCQICPGGSSAPRPPWEQLGMCCWRRCRNWVFTSGAGTWLGDLFLLLVLSQQLCL